MPEFEVRATVRLELEAVFTVKAEDEEEAEQKAQKIVDALPELVKWDEKTPTKLGKTPLEWSESEFSAGMDSIDEL